MRKGIDISSYQGTIDWRAVKAAGIDFVILRTITKNGKMDSRFEEYYAGASAVGLVIHAYMYSYDLSVNEVIYSSYRLANGLAGKNIGRVWIDMEWSTQKALGRQAVTDIAKASCKGITDRGYAVGIYCNHDWYSHVLYVDQLNYPFWVARYGRNNGLAEDIYRPSGASIWQYTSRGRIAGIAGNVDLNICYDEELLHINNTPPSSYNEKVYQWQYACITDGFSFPRYGRDGKWGTECEAAAKHALVSEKATPSKSQYERVGLAQEILISLGYDCGTHGVDKRCGKNTGNAIAAFQRDHGLTADRCIGPKTWPILLGVK